MIHVHWFGWLRKRRWGLLAGIMVAFWPSFALACTPPVGGHPTYTTTEHTNAAPIVLEGTVIAGTQNDSTGPFIASATVEVSRYFKGIGGATVTIEGFGSSSQCRTQVNVGNHRIFFVKIGPNGQWQAHQMGVSDAVTIVTAEVVAEITAAVGSPPVPPLNQTPTPSTIIAVTSIPVTAPIDSTPTASPQPPELPRELPATNQQRLPLIWWLLGGLGCLSGGLWLRHNYRKSAQ